MDIRSNTKSIKHDADKDKTDIFRTHQVIFSIGVGDETSNTSALALSIVGFSSFSAIT